MEDEYKDEMKKVINLYKEAIALLKKVQLELIKESNDKKNIDNKIEEREAKEFDTILSLNDEKGKQIYSNDIKRQTALTNRMNAIFSSEIEFKALNDSREALDTTTKIKLVEIENQRNLIKFYDRILSLQKEAN